MVFSCLPQLNERLRRFRDNASGMALVEFALIGPIFLAVGFAAMEIANFAVVTMRISQLGMNIGDNVSRIGAMSATSRQQIYESDIEDSVIGSKIQGQPIDFATRGRIIISTLQQNNSGKQWIAWQRCFGLKNVTSRYGPAGTGRTQTNDSFPGMGATGDEIKAPSATDAVIYVEIAYDYNPIVEPFAKGLKYFGLNLSNQTIRFEQAYIVRSPRELGVSSATSTSTNDYGLYQNSSPFTRRDCSTFSAT